MTRDARRLLADGVLVAEAQAGSATAMDELISILRPMIFRYCRSKLATYSGGVDAADDAAQETCMAVYKVLPRYRPQGAPFAAWVFSIAANKVADAQRNFSRSATPVDDLPEVTDASLTPEEQVIASVNVRTANELLGQLPDKMRQVVLLRASGVSAEETAEGLGMSAGAVRVTHHRAVAKLRQLASAHEAGELVGSRAGGKAVA